MFQRSAYCAVSLSIRGLARSQPTIKGGEQAVERPRRALPWEDVQRLLRAVDTSTARGLRDHALLLMMSTYGLGAGEVIGLQLQDIDWDAGTLQMSRPKTGVTSSEWTGRMRRTR